MYYGNYILSATILYYGIILMADYELRKIREIRRRLTALDFQELDLAIRARRLDPQNMDNARGDLAEERYECYRLLDQWESRYLLKKAESWGIEVPQKPEWRKVELKEDRDGNVIQVQAWLNEAGKAVITKKIRDARFEEWKRRSDLLVPILALLVAALALFKDIIIEVLENTQK